MDIAEGLKNLGTDLAGKLERYKSDRRVVETQWLKDLRQYRAEYDPEVKARLDPERSQVYPRETRWAIIGFTAKMMEMMFPATEKNFSIREQKYPDLEKDDLAKVLDNLKQQRLQDAQVQGTEPVPLTANDVASAVRDFAKERAMNMESLIDDQLTELTEGYPELCKQTVRNGGKYGLGVVKGPMLKEKREDYWKEVNGEWQAVNESIPYPDFERCRVWDIFPDLSAKTWREQEGLFERFVMSPHDFRGLMRRKDFLKDAIKGYLSEHTGGNYKLDTYENELNRLDKTANTSDLTGRRYEVYRYFGFVTSKSLSDIGVDIKEENLYDDMLVDIWFIDDTIIKAEPAVFGDDVGDQYHPYFYDSEDEAGLTGISLPQIIRDSQMKICAIDRMTQDNAATTAGPIIEVDEGRLSRKQRDAGVKVGAFSTIYVDTSDNPLNNNPVVRDIQVNSHIPELIGYRKQVADQLNMESNIQSWTMGNAQPLGEAFRTTSNMSQMMGGANMLTKDQVRAFDRFVSSIIGAMVKWNLKFIAPKRPEIRGSHDVVARGTISLVAKEVRAAAYAQFMQTLSPEERAIIKTRDTLIERLRAADLPTDLVEDADKAAKILEQLQVAQAQAQQAEQAGVQAKTQKMTAEAQRAQAQAQEIIQTLNSKIEALVAKAQAELAKGKGIKDAGQRDTLKLLLDQIGSTSQQGVAAARGAGGTARPNNGPAEGIAPGTAGNA